MPGTAIASSTRDSIEAGPASSEVSVTSTPARQRRSIWGFHEETSMVGLMITIFIFWVIL
ncbi:hypothetical protein BJX65DRAFT_289733, partial [Aspergillus insuetus]